MVGWKFHLEVSEHNYNINVEGYILLTIILEVFTSKCINAGFDVYINSVLDIRSCTAIKHFAESSMCIHSK